ncbi:beta-glucosidase [Purpureocillium lavendulum]|uniref:beta-glucosidase n=1 Tax=Purpureocillium lavendulum TaxID=1247861 RepID=A0AB34FB86_9HYPO|nr:beta-glucosidase [Purpureocillium lavendulum]
MANTINANVSSIMCSYNLVNRTHACENKLLLQGLLKDELDFQGYIVSDWGAQHSTAESANAGLDMAFPFPHLDPVYWGENLTNAISRSGNELVEAVNNTGKPTIVVIHSVGPLILEPIVALRNVVAIIWAGLLGQESGNALVDVLYGDSTPSGKLPYTIATKEADYGTAITNEASDDFREGLYIDYRHFDKEGLEPRYAFGYGLSYTTFDYADLTAFLIEEPATNTLAPGGNTSLYDTIANVSVTIKNTGNRVGAEVAQLYVGLPPSVPDTPAKQLRGFRKRSFQPGEHGTVTFELRRKDLSYWNVTSQEWVMPSGVFNISVGASSRDIRLTNTITID